MQIAHHKVVSIHYTLTNEQGEVLDRSPESEPLAYLHGEGNIIRGLEKALEGRTIGERLTVTVTPSEGYGERDESMVQPAPKSAFEGVDDIQPGMQFQAQSEEGIQLVTVLAVENETVMLDGNHPMAGITLVFDVEISAVRDATSEEIEHGHVHGPGGHHHH